MSMLDEVGTGRLATSTSDVGAARERARGHRLGRVAFVLAVPMLWMWWRIIDGRPFDLTQLSLPTIDPFLLIVGVFFGVMIVTTLGVTLVAGRSPHITYRPEQIDVSLADVKGIDLVKADVVRSLNLFLANRAFRAEMGGTPRRGLLFEGPPGTGKTYLAKAMAAEAGVPFLFVSATSFQSMYYGATARKIRSYFKALRKAARQEGGAIGFIEEIDAIAMARVGGRIVGHAARRGEPDRPHVLRWALRAPGHVAVGGHGWVVDGGHRDDLRGHGWGRQRAARPDAVLRLPGRLAEGAGLVHRPHQPVPAGPPPAPAPRPGRGHDPADRGDEPRRQPRPRAAAPGALRPPAQLRPADPRRASRAHRPLPGPQVPRGRPR